MRRDGDEHDLELDAGDREVIEKLRALPPDGQEPDWHKLEAAIRAEVGSAAPRPWWRDWRWIVPIWALATTATVALIVTRDQPREPVQPVVSTHERTHVDAPSAAPPEAAEAMWLDGEPVDLGDVDDTVLDPIDEPARAALDGEEGDVRAGILPVTDLGWIDNLDDGSVEQVEQWLAKKRS
ncbi:MAG TPA: hypothetical protein VLB44_23275 [Kofleriaceae bacterium]|nr:hypothetical protein [Kofleriaceae bacterium]